MITPPLENNAMATSPTLPHDPRPWWKFGLMWMVVGGPAIVVVASFVTLWLAIRTPDPVVSEDYYQQGININRTLEAQERAAALTPAVEGRNHAATSPSRVPR